MMTILFALLTIVALFYLFPFVGYGIEYLIDKYQDRKQETEFDKDDSLINRMAARLFNRRRKPLAVKENKELGYRETSYCHHCGCGCKSNKEKEFKKIEPPKEYDDEEEEGTEEDDDPFGPPR